MRAYLHLGNRDTITLTQSSIAGFLLQLTPSDQLHQKYLPLQTGLCLYLNRTQIEALHALTGAVLQEADLAEAELNAGELAARKARVEGRRARVAAGLESGG